MMYTSKGVIPNNYGWLEVQLSKKVMTVLKKYIKNQGEDYTGGLAGNIEASNHLVDENDWFYNNVLRGCVSDYIKLFGKGSIPAHGVTAKERNIILHQFWSNFQLQHQFNPVHDHGGVFSFNIWMSIPTDWRQQHELPFSKHSNKPHASNFSFVYRNILGGDMTHQYKLDKQSEGMMLFFPSTLSHTVYPFYSSTKPRISIAGNLHLD